MFPSTYSSGMMGNGHDSRPHASASERPSSLLFTIGVISVAANVLLAAMLSRQHLIPRVADAAPASDEAFDLRNSQLSSQLSDDLRNLSLSREQYETIFDLRRKYGDSLYNYVETSQSKESRDQVEENKKAFNAELAQALGSDFAKQYVRARDYSYQQLAGLAKRNDLPAETAGAIYDLKDEAEATAKALSDTAMTAEQKQEALKQPHRGDNQANPRRYRL